VQVKYDDGDEENLILSNENIRFHVSRDEVKHLNLNLAKVRDNNVSDYDVEEMLAMAASLDDCQDFEPGDIIWAKLTGLCSILFCSICNGSVWKTLLLTSYLLGFYCTTLNYYYCRGVDLVCALLKCGMVNH